ncbi:MAG: cyclic nucleotide-binding domain-containing protein [Spirochaetota bacterium]
MKKSLFKKGAYIYIEGDEDADTVYIVDKGVVQLDRYNKNAPIYKNILKDGEFFGVIASLCNKPRMESAIARADSVVTTFTKQEFINLLSKKPQIAIKVLNYFSNELRAYNEMMIALKDRGVELETPEEALYNHIRYFYNNGSNNYAYYCCKRYLELYPHGLFAGVVTTMLESIKDKVKGAIVPVIQAPYKVYSDQQMIFCEDEPGNEMYIIKEGKVKIVKLSSESEIILSVLKDGDVFGEMALISDKPRNAAAISWGKTVLLPIKKESLVAVMEQMPAITQLIFKELSHRIWFTYIQLESQLYDKPITRIYALLENKLVEKGVSLKSNEPVKLNFGIDELFKMLGYVASRMGKTTNILLSDSNLQFNVGETIVEKPSQLTAKAKYFKSRDHMAIVEGEEDEKKEASQKEVTIVEEEKEETKEQVEEIMTATVTSDEADTFLQYDEKTQEPATQPQEELHTISEEIEI